MVRSLRKPTSGGLRRGSWLPHERRRRLLDFDFLMAVTAGRVACDLCRPWSSDDGRRCHGSSTVTVSSWANAHRLLLRAGCGDDSGCGGRGSNTLSMFTSPATSGRGKSYSCLPLLLQWADVCDASLFLWDEFDKQPSWDDNGSEAVCANLSGSDNNWHEHESTVLLVAGLVVYIMHAGGKAADEAELPVCWTDNATARHIARSSSTSISTQYCYTSRHPTVRLAVVNWLA